MLHGCFASGRYTSTVLFVLSLLVMLSAAWLPASVASVAQPAVPAFLGAFLSRAISALIYVLAAVLLSRQAFFDRGVKWLGALYLWFVAVCTFVNGNPVIAFAALLFLISIILLMFCQYSVNPVGLLFTSFMLLGALTFVTPYSLFFIPLYLLFCLLTNIFSARGMAASLLGLITPFWIVMGTAYLSPAVSNALKLFIEGVPEGFSIAFSGFTLLHLLLVVLVLAVLLPAVVAFVGSSSPAKPLLRRRISFVIVANVYLLLLFCIVGGGAGLFLVCQLPFVAILASYIFAKKETKMSNVYLIFINLIMVAIATQSLWLMHW